MMAERNVTESKGDGKRIVVVTGGARGIGRAICLAFAGADTHVYLNYVSDAAAAEETERLVRENGGEATAACVDVSREQPVKAFFKEIVAASGRIDVLVNNAGITRDALIPMMKEAAWDDVMDVNLKGAFHCIKAVSRQMIKQRYGRIINISSVVGASGHAGQANYAAAKSGLMGLTKSAAAEFAARNITVNAVAPGFIETDMTATFSAEARAQLADRIPLGRIGTPADVASMAVFLASDAAAYITGQVIHVNGGIYM
ncbi:MAG: 3-oxoacyl-[acyl-carrier-protein] reductase [Thermodesulfobacteriota bacterium]|nr:3-oxoacyl-[acyl-carrier-protein] reductase [Thermodesulfobacteriota bacterium]